MVMPSCSCICTLPSACWCLWQRSITGFLQAVFMDQCVIIKVHEHQIWLVMVLPLVCKSIFRPFQINSLPRQVYQHISQYKSGNVLIGSWYYICFVLRYSTTCDAYYSDVVGIGLQPLYRIACSLLVKRPTQQSIHAFKQPMKQASLPHRRSWTCWSIKVNYNQTVQQNWKEWGLLITSL